MTTLSSAPIPVPSIYAKIKEKVSPFPEDRPIEYANAHKSAQRGFPPEAKKKNRSITTV